MSDYGHEFGTVRCGKTAFHFDSWGVQQHQIITGGKTYYFTFSDRFGPLMETKTGREAELPIRATHPFWIAFNMWLKGGKVTFGGVCQHKPAKPGTFWRNDRKSMFLTDPDVDALGYVEVPRP